MLLPKKKPETMERMKELTLGSVELTMQTMAKPMVAYEMERFVTPKKPSSSTKNRDENRNRYGRTWQRREGI